MSIKSPFSSNCARILNLQTVFSSSCISNKYTFFVRDSHKPRSLTTPFDFLVDKCYFYDELFGQIQQNKLVSNGFNRFLISSGQNILLRLESSFCHVNVFSNYGNILKRMFFSHLDIPQDKNVIGPMK